MPAKKRDSAALDVALKFSQTASGRAAKKEHA